MATVTNTIKLPDGSAPSHAAAVVELVASTSGRAAGWIIASDRTILSTARPTVTAGAWTADLTPNVDITPSGTVYKITETVDRLQYVHYIEVGSGGGSVFDLLTDPPGSIDATGLSAHAASATAHGLGGANVSDAQLKAWTLAGAFAMTAITRDYLGVVSSATVTWPDGSDGTFTSTSTNLAWLTVDAFTVSHAASGKTATQPAVTRSVDGQVTAQPAVTVA
jgi:hypothetical protein